MIIYRVKVLTHETMITLSTLITLPRRPHHRYQRAAVPPLNNLAGSMVATAAVW